MGTVTYGGQLTTTPRKYKTGEVCANVAKEALRSAAVPHFRGGYRAAPHHKSVLAARTAPERLTFS